MLCYIIKPTIFGYRHIKRYADTITDAEIIRTELAEQYSIAKKKIKIDKFNIPRTKREEFINFLKNLQ